MCERRRGHFIGGRCGRALLTVWVAWAPQASRRSRGARGAGRLSPLWPRGRPFATLRAEPKISHPRLKAGGRRCDQQLHQLAAPAPVSAVGYQAKRALGERRLRLVMQQLVFDTIEHKCENANFWCVKCNTFNFGKREPRKARVLSRSRTGQRKRRWRNGSYDHAHDA